ncbi:MAG: acetyl-CoA carboxylase biotin carboxyl carrier protein [Pseudomonadota bacterium]
MTKKSHDGDVAFIRALAELLKENELTELEVKREYGEDDSLNVRVSRAQPAAPPPAYAPPPPPAAVAPTAAPTGGAPSAPAPSGTDDPASHPGAVTSPMVGTAYLQAEPGSPAFVKVGDQVEEGDTILIVEAMKTMNQIPAPRGGTVTRILVDDGAPVEYGAPLMIIE